MKPKYCLPIIKTTKQEVFQAIEANIAEYACFEIWLDYIDDLTTEFVSQLLKSYEKNLIFLFRRQKLEKEHMDKRLKSDLLAIIKNSDALVDADVEHQKELVKEIKEKQMTKQFIASYHNYTHTPDSAVLTAVIETMGTYDPSIYKISTYCQKEDDAMRLLQILLQLKKEQKHCIILGMGEKGMVTRVFGTLWGNEMIFAPVSEKEASAPGQLTKQQLESIFTIIQKGVV